VRASLIAVAVLSSTIPIASFPAVAMALARFARVALTDAALGIGPRLFATRVGPTKIIVRLVPINSWVRAAGQNPYETPEDAAAALGAFPRDRVLWRDAPRLRKVLAFVVAPRLAVVGVALVPLGPSRVARATLAGVVQIVTGALGPLSTARALLDAGAATLAREGALVVAAIVLCKWLSVSLLSLPGDLVTTLSRSDANAKTTAKLAVVQLFVFLAVFLSWLVAAVAWLASGA
jgi:hypothetical protein